jgi:small multidrug resistance pump
MTGELKGYRMWFYAATAYNAIWGTAVVLFPGTLLNVVGMDVPKGLPLVQVMGLMVGVYAYAYYLLARDPHRYCGLIWVGLAGKTLGPIGFVYSAIQGSLPWSFAWVCALNDVIWWPAFWSFALKYARKPLD